MTIKPEKIDSGQRTSKPPPDSYFPGFMNRPSVPRKLMKRRENRSSLALRRLRARFRRSFKKCGSRLGVELDTMSPPARAPEGAAERCAILDASRQERRQRARERAKQAKAAARHSSADAAPLIEASQVIEGSNRPRSPPPTERETLSRV